MDLSLLPPPEETTPPQTVKCPKDLCDLSTEALSSAAIVHTPRIVPSIPSEVKHWEDEVVYRGVMGTLRRWSLPFIAFGMRCASTPLYHLRWVWIYLMFDLTVQIWIFVGIPLFLINRIVSALIWAVSIWDSFRSYVHLYSVAFDEAPTDSDFLKDWGWFSRGVFYLYSRILTLCYLSPHHFHQFKKWLDRFPCDEPVSSNDSFWLTDNANNLCNIMCLSVVDRIDTSDLIEQVEKQWMNKIPRFRAVLRSRFGRQVWRFLPMSPAGMQSAFLPSSHRLLTRQPLLAPPAGQEFLNASDVVKPISVPIRCSDVIRLDDQTVVPLDVYEELSALSCHPFDDSLPRWRLYSLEPVILDPDIEQDPRIFNFSYLAIICHHGLMDGAALNYNILKGLTDPKPPEEDGMEQMLAKIGRPSKLQYTALCVRECVRFLAAVTQIVLLWAFWLPEGPSIISGGPASSPSGRRIIAPPIILRKQDLKNAANSVSIKSGVNVTSNDILIAASVQTLFKLRGNDAHSTYSRHSPVLVPMQCRLSAPTRTENVTSPGLVYAPFPQVNESVSDFVVRIHDTMAKTKNRRFTYFLAAKAMVETLPPSVAKWVLQRITHRTTTSISNVVGPPDRHTFRGRIIRSLQFWQPGHGHITLCVAVLHVEDKLLMQVAIDESELACLSRPVTCLGLQELISKDIENNILGCNNS